jgi:hypothetical protein
MSGPVRLEQAMKDALAYLEKRCERGEDDGIRHQVEDDSGAVSVIWEHEREARELMAKGNHGLCHGTGLRTVKVDGVRTKVLCNCPQADDWKRENDEMLTVPFGTLVPPPRPAPPVPPPAPTHYTEPAEVPYYPPEPAPATLFDEPEMSDDEIRRRMYPTEREE